MKKKILVAYDGSDLSKKAVKEAERHVLESADTAVHVISVVKPTGPVTNANVNRQIGDELKKQYEEDMAKIKKEIEADGVIVTTDVIVGEPEENPAISITNYAEEHDMDLIIVGSRGLGNVKKLFLGSVSNNVVQHAKCPVLVMK